uniref:Uncharacterized protein n=1 Tax=Rhizophagus irregularis (strain DAOM 181602 / DAOM 197198 / MUCL 43194) TaxID=747089 RepID=U9T5L2_RHIID
MVKILQILEIPSSSFNKYFVRINYKILTEAAFHLKRDNGYLAEKEKKGKRKKETVFGFRIL